MIPIAPIQLRIFDSPKMTDSKYFTTTKKGEIFELKSELNNDKKEKKKEAVKKVIASMTVGKDVSALFPDVVNCMQTDNLELKKLVYLYLMNYAKSQPDMAIMAVNTFVKDLPHSQLVKDCEDTNPLIRALAVRTMGCIRVDKITEYLCEPLRKCLKDEDPYVRKTAAVCVAKLYDISSSMVEDQGFLDQLKDLLSDSNPMVVANAVAALSEINEASASGQPLVEMNSATINKLLTALNECTEWGQVFILDSLANYTPKDEREAQSICERITPRLAHANAAVVLSAIKVLMKLLEILAGDGDFCSMLTKKLAPPLVTLLSSEPEVQYVALRNINLIVQKRPDILKHEMKVFFVKYNDPIYVKLEKLDIMIRLANQSNIAQVLSELKEYATEVDVDFVRKAVRAIGRCAIKVEPSAERCVSTLLDLIQTKVNYVVQEAIVVIKDIFRKYPNKYESIISTLCENLDTLDEPEARASMVWIIGEYAERIDNADELLDGFLEGFQDENAQVQLQLLTAVVKLFLKRPADTQELVQHILSLATQDSDNPDLRDRGFIYWRLLSTDPAAAKEVVLADKPLISEETDLLEPTLLDELICHISSLASVYHKPPTAFVEGRGAGVRKSLPNRSASAAGEESSAVPEATVIPNQESLIGDLLSMDIGAPAAPAAPAPASSNVDLLGGGLDILLGGGPTAASNDTAPATAAAAGGSATGGLLGDIFGIGPVGGTNMIQIPKITWLPADKGKGLEIQGTFSRRAGQVYMDMTFTNKAMQAMTGFAIQLNKNSFGLVPSAPLQVAPLQPSQSVETSLSLGTTGPVQRMEPLNNLQVAIKNNVDIFYFACLVHGNVLFVEDGQLDKRVFLTTWKEIPAANEIQYNLHGIVGTADTVAAKMTANNIFTIAKRNVEGQDMLYQSLKLTNNIWVLLELKLSPGSSDATLSLKTRSVEVGAIIFAAYEQIIRSP
ncbi:AP-1 complex subunit beta-1 isoform X1 [Anopheles funestus]|uniref:AP-1 complex subunit beta-1 isoform X1 n=2 Tax=Anopheles funestus TaxID=62324 RepID=UPI0020C744E2|nr:AP-1 complex subunit beta-1 isoform X1 [Anopheles funestus]